MRCLIYYLRTPHCYKKKYDKKSGAYKMVEIGNKPVVTIALVKKDSEYARGVAICSYRDHFNKKTGRSIAIARALAGLKIKSNSGKIYHNNRLKTLIADRIKKYDVIPPYKISYFNSHKDLADTERRMLENRNRDVFGEL